MKKEDCGQKVKKLKACCSVVSVPLVWTLILWRCICDLQDQIFCLCVPQYARKFFFFLSWHEGTSKKVSQILDRQLWTACYCLVYIELFTILFSKTHHMKDTGLPSTKKYIVIIKGLKLNLLSEIMIISQLIVPELSFFYMELEHIKKSGNTCACTFF